jgi:ubiquinone/menaquinone biosynthesis C-methylase UbiE
MQPARYDTIRYLEAKRSVDDRALNRRVLEAFRSRLRELPGRPLRVLEVGAGLGTMPVRLWQLELVRDARYTLVDRDGASLREAERRLSAWGGDLDVSFEHAELFDYLRGCAAGSFDVVLAHAVLDLVDVPSLLPLLWRALVPGALALLTINFDGETTLLPELALDREIVRLYHGSMDARVIDGCAAGHSQTGRRLLEQLPDSGAAVLEAGGSDWVVRALDGRYPEDEAYFLHHIIDTIDRELRAHPELDAHAFEAWVRARHAQIAAGELVYVARHVDLLGRAPTG